MPERQQNEQPPETETMGSIAKTILLSGLLGTMSGGPAYLVARFLTDQETAQRWGLGVGIGTAAAMAGAKLTHLSIERAEKFAKAGRTVRARWEVARALVEGAVGFGTVGTIIGIGTENIAVGLAGTGTGLLLGALASYFSYKERVKPFPELIVPEGNSVTRDMNFPESTDGKRYPPVFEAESLKAALEFRELNKERIVRWATSIPDRSNSPDALNASMLATSVFIIPNTRHFPAQDPEGNQDMRLSDVADIRMGIIAHPNKHTFMTWPHQTVFEDKFGESTYFNDKYWQAWREVSWSEKVVILMQYQTSNPLNITPESVWDNYWLLDILENKRGPKRGVRRRVPQPQRRIIPNLAPQQL